MVPHPMTPIRDSPTAPPLPVVDWTSVFYQATVWLVWCLSWRPPPPSPRRHHMAQGALAHIALLVRDLDKAVEDWTRILRVLDPSQLVEPPVVMERFGPDSDPVRWVTFVAPGGAEIQLVQPLGDGPRAQWLAEQGECVDHIAFVHPDPAAAARELDSQGVE